MSSKSRASIPICAQCWMRITGPGGSSWARAVSSIAVCGRLHAKQRGLIFKSSMVASVGWSDTSIQRCGRFYPASCRSTEDRLRHYSTFFSCQLSRFPDNLYFPRGGDMDLEMRYGLHGTSVLTVLAPKLAALQNSKTSTNASLVHVRPTDQAVVSQTQHRKQVMANLISDPHSFIPSPLAKLTRKCHLAPPPFIGNRTPKLSDSLTIVHTTTSCRLWRSATVVCVNATSCVITEVLL